MAIAFDNAQSTNGDTNVFNWTHLCTGSDMILIVQVGIQMNAATTSITGVTYNSVGMTMLRRDFVTFQIALETWYMLAPPTGSAYTVSVSMDSSYKMVCGSISLTGVDQVAPPTTAGNMNSSTETGPQTVNITTQYVNSWLVDFCVIATDDGLPTVNSGQTARWNNSSTGSPDASNSAGRGATEAVTTAQQYGASYDWTPNKKWGIQVIEVKESPVAAGFMKAVDAGTVGKAVDAGTVQNAYTN